MKGYTVERRARRWCVVLRDTWEGEFLTVTVVARYTAKYEAQEHADRLNAEGADRD
jgi:hypothetical protein